MRTFAAEGYDVALLDINGEAGRALEGETHPGRVVFFETDVSKRASIVQSVEAAVAQLGAPDVLFANAGIQKLSSLFDLKDEDVDAIIDVNLKGVLYTVAAVAAHMRDAGRGSIVLMASDQVFAGKEGSIVLRGHQGRRGAAGQVAVGRAEFAGHSRQRRVSGHGQNAADRRYF